MTAVADIAAELRRTARAQADAADPLASVWVSANAGTGKTHVLTMRVLRLMLSGTAPERILCLTYTKAAAAEMSKRVFATLAGWVSLAEPKLIATLADLIGRAPQPADLARARTLFATAIETPGGLKVQTIHAFCERLLKRFPLEAGIAAGFSILDDETANALKREAIDAVLTRASRAPTSLLGRALTFAVTYAADDRFDEILGATLPHRQWLADAVRLDNEMTVTDDSAFAATEQLFRNAFSVRADVDLPNLEREMAAAMPDAELAYVRDILERGTRTDIDGAAKLSAALAAPSAAARCDTLAHFFLKTDGTPRDRLATKGLHTTHPELDAILQRAATRCVALAGERACLRAVTATVALHRLAGAVHAGYAAAKQRRAALDFDDLIERTRSLLATSQSAEWVLYKLDGGLDHLLVDESQDTSPAQWSVVEALAREFFISDPSRPSPRTLFAVGDEKQSIYSFQGAVPEKFADMGRGFAEAARNARAAWREVPLDVSFRTVAPVLDAVDAVFADRFRTPGVASPRAMRHVAKRQGHAGCVEIWQTETDAGVAPGDVWSPFAQTQSAAPAVRLAARIAATIRGWLATGERLASEDRPIRAGDILILVRKRQPFAGPMVAELKKLGIPVAGADRIQLASQIGVQDLLSLGDFLTLPEDDLALATVLKSPMFNLTDDDLLIVAPGRKGTLWKALLDQAAVDPRFAPAAETLKRWRKAADFTPPFEFFAALLDNDGVRHQLLARLGPDAADAIDEFLNLALTYDDDAPPSLAGFVHWLRDDTRVVKRDMEQGRDEVRVMTVHGAKGLEAPIVFLPDTCTTAGAGRRAGGPLPMPDLERPQLTAEPFVWQVKGASRLAPIASARAAQEAKDRAERDRLLYVAMTRARDRLYVAGFEGKRGREAGCWYDIIDDALAAHMTPLDTPAGPVLRLETPQTAAPEQPKHAFADAMAPAPLPAWALQRAPREPQLSVPLAPSRLAPYETDDSGDPSPAPPLPDKLAEPPPLTPAALADQNRFLRGTLTHALLEHLPGFSRADWPRLAKAFIAERGAGLSTSTRQSIASEALAILNHPDFAPLFGPGSAAEVPIVAVLPRPTGDGPPLRLTGQIDRLVDTGREILIVDYKTNRPPPANLDQVADAYIYQLAAYQLALAAIYPGKPLRAAILWTDGPRIMEIPQDRMISYARRLWALDKTPP